MKSIRGNLLALARSGRLDVIAHGCNCCHVMGTGIAEQIKDSFPEVWATDLATSAGAEKLRQISTAKIGCDGRRLAVASAYTQNDWQGDGVLLDYDALRHAICEMKWRPGSKRIAYPKVSVELACSDWLRITTTINEELTGETHMLVEYGDADTETVWNTHPHPKSRKNHD